jgi:phospholipid/cholesterol/gamma-HCH transport system substrate-binding protein
VTPRTAERVVGLFVVGTGLMVGALVALAGFGDEWTHPAVHYTLVLDNGYGVVPGLDVTVAGMRVGRVEDVRLTLDRRVELVLHVDQEHQTAVREDTSGSALLTLSGKVIEIGDGTPNAAVLEDGGRLKPGTNFDPIVGLGRVSVVAALGRLEGLLAEVDALARALEVGDGQLAERLVALLDDIAEGRGTVGQLLRDDALLTDAKGLLQDVDAVVTRLDGLSARLETTAERLDAAGAAVERSGEAVEATGKSVDRSSAAVQSAVADLPATMKELDATLAELDRTMKAIQQLPVIRGKVEKDEQAGGTPAPR